MLATTLLLVALQGAADDAVAARVDGVAITVGAVKRRAEANGPGRPARAEDVLQQLVSDEVLAAEARRMGLASSPEVAASIDRGVRSAAGNALIDDAADRAKIDDAMLRPSFRATADFASLDALYFATKSDAEAARQRIQAGGDFAKEAPRALVARVNPKAADAPPIMRGQMDPALGVVFDAAPGDVVGPVETANGWALARLIRKELGTEAQFAARRAALALNARKQVKAEARKHLAQQLRAKATVKLDEAFLRSLAGTAVTAEQLDHVLATVDGVPLRYRDVYPSVAAISAAAGHAGSAGLKVAVAWQALENLLVEAAAVERGLAKSPAVAAVRPEIERAALATAAAAKIKASVAAPSEKEIEEFYKKNRAAFGDRPFSEVLPIAAGGAANEKRAAALNARVQELRKKASITVDATALVAEKGTP